MKIFIFFILSLVLFCSCTSNCANPSGSDSELSVDSPDKQPQEVPLLDKELPYAFILSPDFDRSKGIIISNSLIAFDFNEVAWDSYPSGQWSVDELLIKYSETDTVRGWASGKRAGVSVTWWKDNELNLVVFMETERNGVFSFDSNSNSEFDLYPLTEKDKTIKIQVSEIGIYGRDWPLPRGLIIGESTIEDIRVAYPVAEYDDGYLVIQDYVWFDKIALQERIEQYDMGYIGYHLDLNGLLYKVVIGLPDKL